MMESQDDEGYTSPSPKDELQQEDIRKETTGIDRIDDKKNSIGRTTIGERLIDWDEIAKLPETPINRHVSWDDLKYPFPYRASNYGFSDRNRTNLETKVFLSDKKSTSDTIIDKISIVELENEVGQGDQYRGRHKVLPSQQSTRECPETVNITATAHNLLSNNLTLEYVSLNQFIDHTFHLMCGRESQSFSLKTDGNFGKELNAGRPNCSNSLFFKNSWIMVHGIHPTTIHSFCDQFLECGSIFKRLNSLSTDLIGVRTKSYGSRESHAVFQSFLTFISNYLKVYQTVIMLKKKTIVTLTQLNAFMKPLRSQLQVLEKIVDSQLDGNMVELLSSLNNLLFTVENQRIVDLIRNLFISCVSAYLRYIGDWIFRGELGPPSEFHISKVAKSYQDRRAWTKQFVQGGVVPIFLQPSVEKIFETGKALNLLNQLLPVINGSRSWSLFASSIGEQIKAELSFEHVETLGITWNMKLNSFYSENAHLVLEVQESITEIISNVNKITEIDLGLAEEKRLSFHKRMDNHKLEAHLREKEKKHELYLSFQSQIKQAKEMKIQRALQEQQEDDKIQEYLRKRDSQYALDKQRLNLQRLPRSASDIDVCDSAKPDYNVHNVKTKIIAKASMVRSSKSEPSSIKNICVEDKPKTFTERLCEVKHELEEEDEVKFNPDKIITRDPQPYHLFPYSEFGKSLLGERIINSNNDTLIEKGKVKTDRYCMNEFLSSSVSIPLSAQNKMINSVLLHHFIKEKLLFHHLAMINNFICLQNGVFSHFLSELLIDEVKKTTLKSRKDLYEKSYRFNMILGEALSISHENASSDPLIKNLKFKLTEDNGKGKTGDQSEVSSKAHSKFQVLNSLRLTYTVVWPLNIILTEEMMSHYETIYTFLMKLIRAELLLERMFLYLKPKSTKSAQLFQLNNFRFRMLHFVRSVRNYINITVIHVAWQELCSKFHELDSFEKIYQHFVSYVKNISRDCLLGIKAEKLMKLILSQLVLVESFCSQLDSIFSPKHEIDWDNDNALTKEEFLELRQKYEVSEEYAKLFTASILKVSTRRIYGKVDNFLEHYNFNGFFQAT